jgi:hypothetical protein
MASPGDVPYGRRLVPVVVDEIALKDPERICFSFPRSANLADGFRDMNFRTVCRSLLSLRIEVKLIARSLLLQSTRRRTSFSRR